MSERVSSGEIYRMVVKIDSRLQTMETDINRRVSNIEIWKAGIEGKIAATVIIGSIIISFVIDWIKERIGSR